MALLFAPVEKCRYYWESILSKTPHEKWIVARNFVTFFYRLTFCPITDPHFKVRWYTWFCAVAFIDSDALIVHMLYVNRHQFLEHLQLLYTMGVSAVTPIHYSRIVTQKQHEYQRLIYFGGQHIYKRNTVSTELNQILDVRAIELIKILVVLATVMVSGFLLYLALPIFLLVWTGERVTMLPYLLPFTDSQSDFGYYLNTLNQGWLSYCICISNVGNDCTFVMILNSLWAGLDTIEYSLKSLAKELIADGFGTEQKKQFRNVLVQVQDLDRLIVRWKILFYPKFLCLPITVAISLPVAFFSIVVSNSLPAFGYVIFGYTQLLLLCYVGNQVQLFREALCLAITELPWYLLPAEQQRDVAHLIHGVQHGCKLTIGPFSELNFQTASNITTNVYSYLMMLLRFVKQ